MQTAAMGWYSMALRNRHLETTFIEGYAELWSEMGSLININVIDGIGVAKHVYFQIFAEQC